jgi:hypothetical protein
MVTRHRRTWKTKFLRWDDTKDIRLAVQEGKLNVKIDIYPIEGTDLKRKQQIQYTVRKLCQSLKRRGQAIILYVLVYEHGGPKQRPLHAHLMVRVERKNLDIIEKMHSEYSHCEIYQTARERERSARYICKQRKSLNNIDGGKFEERQKRLICVTRRAALTSRARKSRSQTA